MHQLGRRGGLHVFRVFRRALDAAAPWSFPESYDLALLSEEEALAACGDPELDLSERSVGRAYGRGSVCIGARTGGQLAGYVWFAFDSAPHLQGVWVKVPPHAIYRYKAYVRPAHRGRGVAPAMYRFADSALRERGRNVVVNCIATHNFASIGASRRSGAETLGYLGYWQAGERFVSYHSRAVRRYGLRFYLSREAP
jgi:ribosomal protein S18 acetylase RimI-like enzyme